MTATTGTRLGVLATHPIQYHAPLFRCLARRSEIDLDVAFLEMPDSARQGEGFGLSFQWDVSLTDGYSSRVLATRRGVGDGFARTRLSNPAKALSDWGIDVLMLTGWQRLPLIQALRAARGLRLPVLMRGESNALRPRGRAVRLLHRSIVSRVDGFLAIGSANRAFYEGYGVPSEHILDAPYFVDNQWFADRAEALRDSRAELRSTFGIPAGSFCFLFAGKLQPKKHPAHLLDALAQLQSASDRSFHVFVVGSGDLEAELRERVRRDRLSVSFAGFLNQSEMPRAYVAADALVLPSDTGETWGLVVNEAMACGLPAIVSDQVGCAADLIIEGRTGHAVPFGDIEALAAAMRRLAGSLSATREMGAAARDHVRANFTVERSADAVVAATQAAIAQAQA